MRDQRLQPSTSSGNSSSLCASMITHTSMAMAPKELKGVEQQQRVQEILGYVHE
jgi:hypothetical protein